MADDQLQSSMSENEGLITSNSACGNTQQFKAVCVCIYICTDVGIYACMYVCEYLTIYIAPLTLTKAQYQFISTMDTYTESTRYLASTWIHSKHIDSNHEQLQTFPYVV